MLLLGSVMFFSSATPENYPGTSIDRAHPGRTDSSSCHVCRTNCGRWGIPNGFYHRHSPVRACHESVTPARTPIPRQSTTPRPVVKAATLNRANSRALSPRPQSEIINTGGIGIALRNNCTDESRTDNGWPDGLNVEIVAEGRGQCVGWSIAEAGGNLSWVRDRFLEPGSQSPPQGQLIEIETEETSSLNRANSRALSPRPQSEIINTGGIGIALRNNCTDESRTDNGWPDGLNVEIVAEGRGQCVGWSIAEAEDNQTWVRDQYLEPFERPLDASESTPIPVATQTDAASSPIPTPSPRSTPTGQTQKQATTSAPTSTANLATPQQTSESTDASAGFGGILVVLAIIIGLVILFSRRSKRD